ncbi:hypothetical protein CCP3SC1_390004 [Gammaproteobacteria bacterium]
MAIIRQANRWCDPIDHQTLQALRDIDFNTPPPVPRHELLQFRGLRTRMAMLAEQGLDIDCMQTEQFIGAALCVQQKAKVVVGRCEYDFEVTDDWIRKIEHHLPAKFFWLATNKTCSDGRVISLPLGLNDFCNYSDFHLICGNTDLILQYRPGRTQRNSQALICFNDNSHPSRAHARRVLAGTEKATELALAPTLSAFIRYLQALAKFDFCICPRGVGIDTHRLWEALYLGCIPIITSAEYLECHKGLPLLVIERWEDLLTMDLAASAREIRARYYDLRRLSLSYWAQQAEFYAMW